MDIRFEIPTPDSSLGLAVDTDCCQAFSEGIVVGSKVINRADFLSHVHHGVKAHDFTKDRVPGQGFIVLPKTVFEHVSAGDGEHTHDPGHYTVAVHRGRADAYLIRERAGAVTFCAVVVYTKAAYLADPEVDGELPDEIKHVVVAVLASSGPESPLPLYTLVNNLAGGNKEALDWTADEIRAKASATKKHWDKYSIVAG
jgi:hypothetical protein